MASDELKLLIHTTSIPAAESGPSVRASRPSGLRRIGRPNRLAGQIRMDAPQSAGQTHARGPAHPAGTSHAAGADPITGTVRPAGEARPTAAIRPAGVVQTSGAAQNAGTARPASASRPARRLRIKTRLSFQERLLRNSFIACAVLLGVLALGNVQQPWALKASRSIEQALTMKVDLDQSLGQLSFVRKLMPESALVFFNLSGDHELQSPVQGSLSHSYQSDQPWLMFEAEVGTAVCAAADGTISAVSPLSDGGYGVLIDHGEGRESVTANLAEVDLQPGDQVLRGGAIGTASGDVYFELRQGGEAVDPTELMGL